MFWKIYAILLTVILVTAYVIVFVGGVQTLHYVDLPISIIALVGLYGFAFQVKLVNIWIWRVWLGIVVAWDMYYNFYDAISSAPEFSPLIIGGIVVAIGIIIPEYIALFLYGFRSHSIWDKEKIEEL